MQTPTPAPHLQVRPATPEDAAAIQHVATTTWRATYHGHLADDTIEQFLARSYSIEALGRTIERLGNGAIVALLDNAVVGYAFAGPNRDDEWELFAIYALPQTHGRGVGRRLWDAALAHARGAGADSLCLWVLRDNPAARGFYAHMGATVDDERSVTLAGQDVINVRYRAACDTAL